jgi:hypothetical protein
VLEEEEPLSVNLLLYSTHCFRRDKSSAAGVIPRSLKALLNVLEFDWAILGILVLLTSMVDIEKKEGRKEENNSNEN